MRLNTILWTLWLCFEKWLHRPKFYVFTFSAGYFALYVCESNFCISFDFSCIVACFVHFQSTGPGSPISLSPPKQVKCSPFVNHLKICFLHCDIPTWHRVLWYLLFSIIQENFKFIFPLFGNCVRQFARQVSNNTRFFFQFLIFHFFGNSQWMFAVFFASQKFVSQVVRPAKKKTCFCF